MANLKWEELTAEQKAEVIRACQIGVANLLYAVGKAFMDMAAQMYPLLDYDPPELAEAKKEEAAKRFWEEYIRNGGEPPDSPTIVKAGE